MFSFELLVIPTVFLLRQQRPVCDGCVELPPGGGAEARRLHGGGPEREVPEGGPRLSQSGAHRRQRRIAPQVRFGAGSLSDVGPQAQEKADEHLQYESKATLLSSKET